MLNGCHVSQSHDMFTWNAIGFEGKLVRHLVHIEHYITLPAIEHMYQEWYSLLTIFLRWAANLLRRPLAIG